MTPPTPDELLRLARLAWPSKFVDITTGDGGFIVVQHDPAGVETVANVALGHERAREALHAALLVLAGELDVAALLAERDRLRAENKQLRDEAFQLEHGWKIG